MAFRSMGFRSMEIRPKVNTKLDVRIFFWGGGLGSYGGGEKKSLYLDFFKIYNSGFKKLL